MSSTAAATAKPKTTISKSGVTQAHNLPSSVSLTKTGGVAKKQFPSSASNSAQTSNSVKGSLVMSKVDPLSGNQKKPSDARQFSPGLTVSKVIQAELGKPEAKKPIAAAAAARAASGKSSTVTKLPSVSASAVASAKKLLQVTKTSNPVAIKLSPAQEAMAKLKSFRNTLPKDLKKHSGLKEKQPKPKPKNTQQHRPPPGVATSKASVKSQPEVISLNEDDDDDDVICID